MHVFKFTSIMLDGRKHVDILPRYYDIAALEP